MRVETIKCRLGLRPFRFHEAIQDAALFVAEEDGERISLALKVLLEDAAHLVQVPCGEGLGERTMQGRVALVAAHFEDAPDGVEVPAVEAREGQGRRFLGNHRNKASLSHR